MGFAGESSPIYKPERKWDTFSYASWVICVLVEGSEMGKQKEKSRKKEQKKGVLGIKKRCQIRRELKKRFVQKKYGGNNSAWLYCLQTSKQERIQSSETLTKAILQSSQLTCSICYNLFIFPVLLPCGHIFCRPCIEQATLHNNCCCFCRKPIELQHFTVSERLNKTILSTNVSALSHDQKIKYWDRYCDYIIWQHLTMIDPQFKKGQLVHFFDKTRDGWRYGVITNAKVEKGVDLYLFVEPLWKEEVEECYKYHYLSRKVAKFQFFFQAEQFVKDWEQNIIDMPQPESRDNLMRRTIAKRLAERRTRTSFSFWWKPNHLLYDHLSLNDNIYRYVPPFKQAQRPDHYNKIADYNFTHFHDQLYIPYSQAEDYNSRGAIVQIQESYEPESTN